MCLLCAHGGLYSHASFMRSNLSFVQTA